MHGFDAILYSFLFGLLHGILPDEHTWPITFSYAIGGASGKQGMKAGLYFSSAFTFQRMLLSEVARLALAPFLLSARINAVVYIIVGMAMCVAGAVVLKKNRYLHLHVAARLNETTDGGFGKMSGTPGSGPLPVHWTLIHGFIAGFGFGGFSFFVNAVAAPAMKNPWLGFLPGLSFGIGTMITIIVVSALFGASLRWTHRLTEDEVKKIGTQTGGRTLFFGGLLFAVAGIALLLGLDRYLTIDAGYLLIGSFMVVIVVPAFVYSWREVRAAGTGHRGRDSRRKKNSAI
jgi:hypothetical protein